VVIRPDALFQCLQEDTADYLLSLGVQDNPGLSYTSKDQVLYPSVAACLRLRESVLKKLRSGTSEALDLAALKKFLAINDQQDDWDRRRGEELFAEELLGHFREEMHRFFEVDNRRPLIESFEQFFARGRFGPGASLKSVGTDFYSKVGSSDLTATSSIFFRMYRSYIANRPGWRGAEFFRTAAGFGDRIVTGNKLAFVPKNVDISRTICVEPSLNMFAQLGLADLIERRLKSLYSIDLTEQPEVNRALARKGSKTGSLITIDLESASDSISLKMIEKNLPRDVVAWLKVLRSPVSETLQGPVELRMVSTMGNGFTFPLQTAIFSSVVLAAKRFLGRPRTRAGKDWSVFGDDIICSQHDVGAVLSLLRILGFQVNPQKSFFEGPFRESCGHDYYRGHDIRGVYIKSLSTVQDRFVAINRLNDWSSVHGVNLPRTVRLLQGSVPDFLVPLWESDTAGIRVTSASARHLKVGFRWRFRASEFIPSMLRFDEGLVRGPRGTKRRVLNPEALYLAFLNGSLEHGTISIRHSAKSYRTRTRYTLNWDIPGASHTLLAERGWCAIVSPVENRKLTGPRRESAERANLAVRQE
jgi:hypothetical protein